MNTLDVGSPFPHLTIETVSGKPLRLPGDLGGAYGIILFYRGRW